MGSSTAHVDATDPVQHTDRDLEREDQASDNDATDREREGQVADTAAVASRAKAAAKAAQAAVGNNHVDASKLLLFIFLPHSIINLGTYTAAWMRSSTRHRTTVRNG